MRHAATSSPTAIHALGDTHRTMKVASAAPTSIDENAHESMSTTRSLDMAGSRAT